MELGEVHYWFWFRWSVLFSLSNWRRWSYCRDRDGRSHRISSCVELHSKKQDEHNAEIELLLWWSHDELVVTDGTWWTEPSCRKATVMSSSLQNPDLYRADSISNTNPTNPSLLSHLIGAHLNVWHPHRELQGSTSIQSNQRWDISNGIDDSQKLVSDLSRLRKLFPLDPSDGSSAESSCDRVCEIVKKEEWGDDVEKQMRVLKVEFGSESLIEV